MKIRLVLITEIIAPYRIPVFNALAARSDIDLNVIFLAESDAALRQWLVYKNEIRFCYQVLPSRRSYLGSHTLLLNWGVGKALAAANPQVILCGGYNYPASWRAAYWAKHRNVPFLLWIESTASDTRAGHLAIEALKRKFFSLCRGFVVPGRASADYVRSFGVDARAIFIAPNAIDNELFRNLADAARLRSDQLRQSLNLPGRYFLNVSRLVEAKGVFDLLQAYAKLDDATRSAIGLVMVGDGAAREELERRAGEISPGTIQFRGFVQRDELPAYYALAEALVFPTHSDTWGFVVNEAMACGIPVIASEVAGCTADLVHPEQSGLLVLSGDPRALANAMTRIAGDPTLRNAMARRATEIIANNSPENCAAGIAAAAAVAAGGRG